MRRFRRLTLEELQNVRPEFVKYLASEGITAEDWEQKLLSNSSDVVTCLDEFSTKFWEGATQAIVCLEHSPGDESLWVFRFDESSARLIQCSPAGSSAQWSQGTKSYAPEARGQEIFQLLEQGAKPCSEERFSEIENQMKAATQAS